MIDRSAREEQALGDLPVSETVGDEAQDLRLASREADGTLTRRASRASGKPANSALAQLLGDPFRRGPRAEIA